MRRAYISFLLILLILPLSHAQNSLLDKVKSKYESSKGISAVFTIMQEGTQGKIVGDIKMAGEKFVLNTPEIISWYNGKEMWSYMFSTREVNLSTPSLSELQNINPYAIINGYKKGFTEKTGTPKNGKQTVTLIPKNKQSDFKKIVLIIDSQLLYPLSVTIYDKNNKVTQIEISKYKSGLNYPDRTFVFDKKNYPDAELIDLR
ncbi:outer-membrane lipoprotein carrier protein LolA [Barnesiella propionica]|uniref:LolA family protein n=1 Tax=Barnesiella propionica TaxID=2981781 RepID=UPI0011C7A6BB|nr:LolA-like putative outer membrane lipoprotein chaperone [Barnesiella propionica]MCU6767942.1 outer-membrane lipoprotein carrier protein LolA [Barnesiella propionica]